MPPRRRAQCPYRDACPDCGRHAWHQPDRGSAWLCINCGYNPAQPERFAGERFVEHAQAVQSHDNEQTERIVPSHADELKSHFDDGLKRLVEDILRQLRPTHEQLLKVVEESRAEVATLAATVTEMRDTIKSLTAENGGLRNELQTAREALSALTRASTTPPPPPATPTPPARAPPKRKRTESQSPRQPTKQARDTSPTPTLMHSKHAGPSVTTGPTEPPPTTSQPPRVDSAETEEGWKKVERKRWKGKREKKVGPAGGVPTWADIARGGGVSVNVFIGGGVGYTKPKARRPAGKRKKQQGQQRPASSSIAG